MEIQTISLKDLGSRICIFGPSSSGKSTLAAAISIKLDLKKVHLDQLYHLPDGDWIPRSRTEFLQLHNAAIQHDAWVMEGNYSVAIPARLKRATGIILLSSNRWGNLRRYLIRTLCEPERMGALAHVHDRLSWLMVYHILVVSPANERKRLNIALNSGLPLIRARGFFNIKALFADWELS